VKSKSEEPKDRQSIATHKEAMRDYFGAHTYHKIDANGHTIVGADGKPTVFHTEWMLDGRPEVVIE